MHNTPNTPNVAIIAYGGVQMSAVLGLGDILDVANRYATKAGIPIISYAVLQTDQPLTPHVFDVVILPPNLSDARGKSDHDLHHWIATQHAKGAVLCSACARAFWLGYAGILNGRPVTTHWALDDEFQETFPTTPLCPEHLLVDDHDIVTAGG